MQLNRLFFFLVLSVVVVACQGEGGDAENTQSSEQTAQAEPETPEIPENSVTGVISYRESKTIPPDTEIFVRLVDLNQTGEERLISEVSFMSSGRQIPIDFVLPYEPEELDENGNFALEGLMAYAGFKIFEEIQPVEVINNGNRRNVVLMMRTARGKVEE